MKIQCTLFIVGCIVFSMGGIPIVGDEASDDYALYLEVMQRLESLTPDEKINVKIGTEKDEYLIDEAFEVRFMVSEACYMVLMDIGAATTDILTKEPVYGDITFLIPSYKVLENKLEPGRVYSSLHDFDMKITVAQPAGYETVNLFCSPEPLALFDADFTKERVYTVAPHDTEKLKALLEGLQRLEQQEWAGSSVSFLIKDPRGNPKGALPKKFGTLKPMGGTGTTGKSDERFFPPLDGAGQ